MQFCNDKEKLTAVLNFFIISYLDPFQDAGLQAVETEDLKVSRDHVSRDVAMSVIGSDSFRAQNRAKPNVIETIELCIALS